MRDRELGIICLLVGSILFAVAITLIGADWFYAGFALGLVVGIFACGWASAGGSRG